MSLIAKPEPSEDAPPAGPPVAQPATQTPEGEPGELRLAVEDTIEAIRPALQMDGGDVTLVGVDEATGVVDIELIGACVGCPASTMTLKAGIERILKDRVAGITEVNAVGLEPAFDF